MLGISTSIFNEASGLVKDWLKNPLNSSFFFWYFLPAVGFVLLQLFIIGPALGRPAPQVFNVEVAQGKGLTNLLLQILSASFFTLIVLPLVAAAVMSALSGRVLLFFQGALPIARPLFQPLVSRNRRRNTELYGPLLILRRQYLFLVSHGVRLENVDGEERAVPVSEAELPALIEQLKQQTQAIHEQIESHPDAPELPKDIERVGATDLANTLALAEEYPFERYAIDTALFWPRLSAEIEPEKLDGLRSSFGALNGLLNLSLLIFLFAVESLIAGVAIALDLTRPSAAPLLLSKWSLAILLFAAALASVVAAYGAYRAAVGSARAVGNAMRTAFDYYRGNVLRRFNLKIPNDIEEERVVWLKLSAFIRRGESFYYPSEFRAG
jgi:hypothetical protein